MKLIVGLGNPGKEYLETRHNVGFGALFWLAKTLDPKSSFLMNKKIQALSLKGKLGRKQFVMMMPETFMNDSGTAVQAALNFYKLSPSDLLVIHDDKDIPFGETRLQTNRGPAGHNGVLSIIEKIGTQDFMRIRIGVAPLDKKIINIADFVLEKFTAEEQSRLETIFEHVAGEVKNWLAS